LSSVPLKNRLQFRISNFEERKDKDKHVGFKDLHLVVIIFTSIICFFSISVFSQSQVIFLGLKPRNDNANFLFDTFFDRNQPDQYINQSAFRNGYQKIEGVNPGYKNKPSEDPDTLDLTRNSKRIIDSDLKADIVFKGRFFPNVYGKELDSLGLIFKSGKSVQLSGTIRPRPQIHLTNFEDTWHDSPLLNLSNHSTVRFSGRWLSDNNYSKPVVHIREHSKFILGKEAYMNLVFPAYGNFTRQLWVGSDGTGVFEVEKGFVADLSQKGSRCEGAGCFRFVNCTFISHDSASLPVYFRPEPTDKSKSFLNSHLVFENGDLSKWKVETQRQNFIGGLWMYNHLEVQTNKQLLLTGNFAHWSDYTNYGGLIFCNPNVTLTKTGKDTLTLDGQTCTALGSQIEVKKGVLYIKRDLLHTEYDSIKLGKNKLNGNYLKIKIRKGAVLRLNTDSLRINELEMESGAILDLVKSTEIIAKKVVLAGKGYSSTKSRMLTLTISALKSQSSIKLNSINLNQQIITEEKFFNRIKTK